MSFKRKSYYFTSEDEAEFSLRLREAFPAVRFRDGHKWHVSENPYRETINDCTSHTAYIWNPALFPSVPQTEAGGWIEGAATGTVLQFARSRLIRGELHWGQLGASYDESSPSEKRYTEKVFRILQQLKAFEIRYIEVASGNILRASGGSFLLGAGAAAFNRSGGILSSTKDVRLGVGEPVANRGISAAARKAAAR